MMSRLKQLLGLVGCAGLALAEVGGCASAPPVVVASEVEAVAPGLTAQGVAPGVWVVVDAAPWPANSLVAELEDGTLLVVDTPYTVGQTELLLDWMGRRFGAGRPVVAINTHFHPDALGGNPALLARGARVYTSDRTAATLRKKGEATRAVLVAALGERPAEQAALREGAWVIGDQRFTTDEPLKLWFGGEDVEVFYPGPGHAPDNVVVWLGSRGVLFGGCLIRAQEGVGNRSDADLEGWRAAVEAVRARYAPAVVVAGHGGWGGEELLEGTAVAVEEALGLPPAARGQ